METLNSETAKKFAFESFKSAKIPSIEKKFLKMHSLGVVKTSLKLAKLSKNKNLDLKSLEIAGLLHDVGRTIQIEHHADLSIKLSEEKFGKLNPIVFDCIKNHGNSKSPETQEGRIMQLADKLSIANDFNLYKLLFKKEKYKPESLDMFKMVFDHLIEILKRYNFEE